MKEQSEKKSLKKSVKSAPMIEKNVEAAINQKDVTLEIIKQIGFHNNEKAK